MHSGVSGLKFDYKCFRILVGEKWWHLKTKAKLGILFSTIPLTELRQDFAFIYNDNSLTRFPDIKKIKGQKYYPPLNQISNLTIAELAVADDLYIKWRNTKDIECLYYLAATLYVIQQQPRPPFDKNDLAFKGPLFKDLSMAELLTIELAFHGCKEYLAKKFTKAFPKGDDTKTTKTKSKPTSSQFPQLILHLSGGKFGTHEQTGRTNCYTFLAEFENLLKEQKS